MENFLKKLFSPDRLEIDLQFVKLEYSKESKEDIIKVVSEFKKRGALIDNINEELWLYTFQSLVEMRDLITELIPNLSDKSQDVKIGLNQILDALTVFLGKYRNDYLRYHDNPSTDTYRPRRDWGWPNLANAAKDLYLTRELIWSIVEAFKSHIDSGDEIFRRPNIGMTDFLIKGSEEAQFRMSCNLKVLFEMNVSGIQGDIFIAGSFNEWNSETTKVTSLGGSYPIGNFGYFANVTPGKYAYKLYNNGKWFSDPSNPLTEIDENGNVNSIIFVK